MIKFPKNFLWGAATAAHQVESDTQNNWTATKNRRKPKTASEGEKYYRYINSMNGIFDEETWDIIKEDVIDLKQYTKNSLVAHEKQLDTDLDIAKSLNLNTYRFSIEWSKIEPQKGKFSKDAIAYYRNLLKNLKERNIEPVVTLWHFSHPIWFEEIGSWKKTNNVKYFKRYVQRIVKEFGTDIKYWLTLNEPNVYTFSAYLAGDYPPFQTLRIPTVNKVLNNFVMAHKVAYRLIKKANPDAQISVAMHQSIVWTEWYNPIGRFYKFIVNRIFNYWFLDKVEKQLDFIGINYYMILDTTFKKIFRSKQHDLRKHKDIIGLSDMGWYLYPKGLAIQSRKLWKRYHKPILVTEHGTTDKTDRIRAKYLKLSLAYLSKIMDQGVNVIGYIHWSLFDNLEWADGHWPRFGLVEIDYKTGKRIVRKSAKMYADIIKKNSKAKYGNKTTTI